jgi:hypothetical protein
MRRRRAGVPGAVAYSRYGRVAGADTPPPIRPCRIHLILVQFSACQPYVTGNPSDRLPQVRHRVEEVRQKIDVSLRVRRDLRRTVLRGRQSSINAASRHRTPEYNPLEARGPVHASRQERADYRAAVRASDDSVRPEGGLRAGDGVLGSSCSRESALPARLACILQRAIGDSPPLGLGADGGVCRRPSLMEGAPSARENENALRRHRFLR